MSTVLKIQTDSVPSSFCPLKNADWAFLVSLLSATLDGDPTINVGNATPTPDKRGLPWFRTNSDGTPDRWYMFNNGLWIAPHPMAPFHMELYRQDPTTVDTLDGGTSGAVTAYSGPFWAIAADMAAKFPVGVGTMPSGAAITLEGTGGEELHTLLAAEIASHSHPLANVDNVNRDDNVKTLAVGNQLASEWSTSQSGLAYALQGTATPATLGLTGPNLDPTVPVVAHNTLPPWYGVNFIERTGRLWFTQPG